MESKQIELGNLYDINKNAMKNEKPLSQKELEKGVKRIKSTIKTNFYGYYTLLCREKYDFTIFHFRPFFEEFSNALLDCLNNRGKVKSIEEIEKEVFEIWIEDNEDNENYVYYFFPYDKGVLEVSLQ